MVMLGKCQSLYPELGWVCLKASYQEEEFAQYSCLCNKGNWLLSRITGMVPTKKGSLDPQSVWERSPTDKSCKVLWLLKPSCRACNMVLLVSLSVVVRRLCLGTKRTARGNSYAFNTIRRRSKGPAVWSIADIFRLIFSGLFSCHKWFWSSLPLWTASSVRVYTPPRTLRSCSDSRIIRIQQYKRKAFTVLPTLDLTLGTHAPLVSGIAQPFRLSKQSCAVFSPRPQAPLLVSIDLYEWYHRG